MPQLSALPTPPDPSDIPQELQDAALGITIGSASWLIRFACSPEKATLGYILRRTITAGLTSLLVGVATKGYFNSEAMGFAAAGCAGYASPELVDLLLAKIKSFKKAQ